MPLLSDKEIERILDHTISVSDWEVEYEQARPGQPPIISGWHLKFKLRELDLPTWPILKEKLHDMICEEDGKIRAGWEELTNGNARDLVQVILTLIVTKLDLVLAMAIPATALVVKHGLVHFCQTNKVQPPEPSKPAPKPKRVVRKKKNN